ncbi:MAG: hypothetical protein LBH11_07450 [Propionibacteriaceae bacterium]|nr:hypothetical protein [Propionibacteriaceae bacterium]
MLLVLRVWLGRVLPVPRVRSAKAPNYRLGALPDYRRYPGRTPSQRAVWTNWDPASRILVGVHQQARQASLEGD